MTFISYQQPPSDPLVEALRRAAPRIVYARIEEAEIYLRYLRYVTIGGAQDDRSYGEDPLLTFRLNMAYDGGDARQSMRSPGIERASLLPYTPALVARWNR